MTPEERKNQILHCAKKLFSKKGYYETQIADIVDQAKIARGTIYNYFKNKDDIFVTLLNGYCLEWQEILENDPVDLNTITARDFLNAKIRKTLEFFANDRYLTHIILRVGIGLPGGLEVSIRRFEEIILNVISDYLRLGIQAGNVKKELNIEMTADFLCGAILRTAYAAFGPHRRVKERLDIAKLSDEITDLVAGGIFVR